MAAFKEHPQITCASCRASLGCLWPMPVRMRALVVQDLLRCIARDVLWHSLFLIGDHDCPLRCDQVHVARVVLQSQSHSLAVASGEAPSQGTLHTTLLKNQPVGMITIMSHGQPPDTQHREVPRFEILAWSATSLESRTTILYRTAAHVLCHGTYLSSYSLRGT